MKDTGRTRAYGLVVATTVLLTYTALSAASVPKNRVAARVIWTRGETVFLASSDSIRLDVGSPLIFEDRGKRAAAGYLTRVVDGVIGVVALTSGSLPSAKRWERLSVIAEPRVERSAPLLRVGFPGLERTAVLEPPLHWRVPCTRLLPPALDSSYVTEIIGERAWRGRRVSINSSAVWPDTLLIRLFNDSGDEEIALQRGEIDAAVFWSGEETRYFQETWAPRVAFETRWRGPTLITIVTGIPNSRPGGVAGPDSLTAGRVGPVRCTVVTTPAWSAYVRALGPDSLANLLACPLIRK